MDSLFDIPETTPKWRELADQHGISAALRSESDEWTALVEWFGEVEMDRGDTEKEAVVALIHRLQLAGWETVSL